MSRCYFSTRSKCSGTFIAFESTQMNTSLLIFEYPLFPNGWQTLLMAGLTFVFWTMCYRPKCSKINRRTCIAGTRALIIYSYLFQVHSIRFASWSISPSQSLPKLQSLEMQTFSYSFFSSIFFIINFLQIYLSCLCINISHLKHK